MTDELTHPSVITRLFSDRVRPPGPAEASAAVHVPDAAGEDEDVLLAAVGAALWRHTGEQSICLAVLDGPGQALARAEFAVDPDAPGEELVGAARSTRSRAVAGAAPWIPAPDGESDPGVVVLLGPIHAEVLPAAELVVRRDGTALRLDYDARVFEQASVNRLAGDIAGAVRALAGEVPAVARAWPVPSTDTDPDAGLDDPDADLIGLRAAAWPDPDAVTLACGERQLSAGVLAAHMRRIASRLTAERMSGRRVAVLVDHDIDGPIAVWSVLLARATYVPLDPRQPDARLSRILADADVGALVCSDLLTRRARTLLTRRARAAGQSAPVIPLGTDVAAASATDSDGASPDRDQQHNPDQPAYLLHTSGTTGRPKAIVQTRRNVAAHARVYADSIGLGPGDRVALLAPITFDAAVMDLFGSAMAGASLHVVDPVQPAPALLAELARQRVTVLHCTPSLVRHLLGAPRENASGWAPRVVVLGGEQVGPDDVRLLRKWFPDTALVNGLGPSECTMALQHRIDDADAQAAAVPVGRPVPGVAAELIDAAGRVAAVVGELVLVTDRVASGYWQLPELTEQVFSTGADGRRRYRSGDVVRRRADGELVFLGRRDRQVKVRGHRVEPAEIEAVLRSHPTVAQATVVLASDPEPRLVAYATPATVFAVAPQDLREFLTRQLPSYAVPAAIVALDSMPLGPTGKLDHARLPTPPDPAASCAYATHSSSEQRVVEVWQDVLRVGSINIDADFLASGGDSLSMMAMLAEVKQRLGVTVELADFLRDPRVSSIAAAIEDTDRAQQEA